MSSVETSPPQWQWSEDMHRFYYVDGPKTIVAEDGRKYDVDRRPDIVPRVTEESQLSADPQHATTGPTHFVRPRFPGDLAASRSPPPGTPPGTARGPQRQSASSRTHDSHVARPSTDDIDSLQRSTASLRIIPPPELGTSSSIHRGVNHVSHVQSMVTFGPKADITQPDLYAVGVRAHAKVLAGDSTDDKELIDPDIPGIVGGTGWRK
ncbi:hypothetical protein LTR95_009379 [Oleoguttula sp. CCFEE 5521]